MIDLRNKKTYEMKEKEYRVTYSYFQAPYYGAASEQYVDYWRFIIQAYDEYDAKEKVLEQFEMEAKRQGRFECPKWGYSIVKIEEIK